jgi:glycosyltransferase involved in cell wall biosynthesis
VKIGIGVTTRNRPELFHKAIAHIVRLAPPDARIEIVDDASAVAVDSTFRFEHNVGIARAKNKCLSLLDDCDHIFLFDDDIYPVHVDWWKPYVESPEPHLMYIFAEFAVAPKHNNTQIEYGDEGIVSYSKPCGCMLYVHHRCLEVVGGMDERYGLWGYEHADFSNRVHSAGLTTYRFADIPGSGKLFHSADEHREVASAVSNRIRYEHIQRNKPFYEASRHSIAYMPYKS